jgi:hypothetical protein
MQISDILNIINIEPISIEPYLWKNYGNNHFHFDFESTLDKTVFLTCVADFKGNIKELSFYFNEKYYLWVDPEFIQNRNQAYFDQNLDPRFAFENIKYLELEVQEDVFNKINTIFNHNVCDEKILISLDLGEDAQKLDDVLTHIKETDPNFNIDSFVETALTNYISQAQTKNLKIWDDIKSELNNKNIIIHFKNSPSFIKEENKNNISSWLGNLGSNELFITFKDKLTQNGIIQYICVNDQFEFEYIL